MEYNPQAITQFKEIETTKLRISFPNLPDNKISELTDKLLTEQIILEKIATDNCLLRVISGSHSYGTNIPGSDWDERGIFTDTIENIILPFDKTEQVKFMAEDIVYFELSKYMPLLLAQNPNVLELLWTAPDDILYVSPLGKILLENRQEFLSIKVKDSYIGYATSQLKRIKGHNKWLNNPQKEEEPELKDFSSVVWNYTDNLSFNKKIPFEGYIAVAIGDEHYSLWESKKFNINKSWIDKRGNPNPILKTEFDKINTQKLAPDIIVKINKKQFEETHNNWKSYWNWKKNRNEKRSELEEKYGYDTKHAMHLIRLLRSGIDILEKGIVLVKREDADYLLDIRFGKFTYENIVTESQRLSQKVEELSRTTKLPIEPNTKLAKEVMLLIYQEQWKLVSSAIKKMKI